MEDWKTAMRRGLSSGSSASVLSTLALAAAGKYETGSVSAPTNAISHWFLATKPRAATRPRCATRSPAT